MVCKICNTDTIKIFEKKVLHKYDVSYYQCRNCKFIQTDEPFWLDEAYKSAINSSDTGLVSRGAQFGEMITVLLRLSRINRKGKFLDFGAGHGLFVRIMRDNGFNFYWSDQYCENIYAKMFQASDLPAYEQKYDAITAFEVMEHLVKPNEELEHLLSLSDTVIFSTELSNRAKGSIEDWWYLGLGHGQHIAIFHIETLKYLAKKYNLHLSSNKNLHCLSKHKINKFVYKFSTNYPLARLFNTLFPPGSLMDSDFNLHVNHQ